MHPGRSLEGTLSFLAGSSEMARRIREHDWTRHPFGPPENWPQSLRSALSICLHSAFPTAIYWGPELRLLYNDAWSSIPGPRHPAALGAPAHQVWSDIWHVIEPQFARLLETGDGFFAENQMLPMQRYGAVEETYWNYSFTAIRGEAGEIAGIFNSGNETTDTVLSQRRMGLIVELGQALRDSIDSAAARSTAMSMLGQHLDTDRAGFCEVAPDGEVVTITDEWVSGHVQPMDALVQLSHYGSHIGATLLAGRVLRVEDVEASPELQEPATREALARIGLRSFVVVPQMDEGRFVAAIYLHCRSPRRWSDHDVVTVQQVLDWTWNWVQRERASEREALLAREIDHRAKNAIAVVQGVIRLTSGETAGDFREKVEARIAALARAHSLLAAGRWAAVDFRTLLHEELAPFAAGREESVATAGPAVELPPELAQTVALVLHELTTNAVKYGALSTPEGELRVSWCLDEDRSLSLSWSESQPAMPTRANGKGTGFGSGLLSKVVEQQLRGRIERSWSDTGVRWSLVIPLHSVAPARSASAEPGPADRSSAPPRSRVLIAEDEPILALELEDRIRSLGHEVLGPFGTEGEALEALQEGLPDLAILDVNLRGTPSYRIAETLRRNTIPVVFATGYELVADLPEELAGLPIVSKPFSDAELEAALEQALATAPARERP